MPAELRFQRDQLDYCDRCRGRHRRVDRAHRRRSRLSGWRARHRRGRRSPSGRVDSGCCRARGGSERPCTGPTQHSTSSAHPTFLVNNAGIVRFGPLLDQTVDDWRAVVDVNLTGMFVCSTACARRMAGAGGGSIVSITSINGIAPGPNAGAYGATKAAINMLSQQMSIEWGPMECG